MTSVLKSKEAKLLREDFSPSFEKSSFDLKVPKLDISMQRRLNDLKTPEASKAEAREKILVAQQYKILDVSRPLLFMWGNIASDPNLANSPLLSAAVSALQLWGNAFHSVTGQRRENVLKQTDPRYESLLKDPENFKKRDCASLFGKSFLRKMVREASDDQKLKALARSSQPSSSSRRKNDGNNSRGSKNWRGSGNSSGFSFQGGSNKGSFNSGSSSNRGSGRLVFSPIPSVKKKVGARLLKHAAFWHELTSDPWVIQAVTVGARIPLLQTPYQAVPGFNMAMSEEASAICEAEVASLLAKGAVTRLPDSEQCFVSGIFVIPKSSGGFRPITNLKGLNKFVEHQHFKMEGLNVLKDIVRKGDFFTKIDLQDAYLTVPIHPDDKKFLQFRWGGSLFGFSCLCFGLASAPWTFTKLVKPIVAFLRRKGIRIVVYLDDFLILNQSKEGAEKDFLVVKDLLERCGFIINFEKSIAEAAQEREFLGLMVDSVSLTLSLPQKKLDTIVRLCREAAKAPCISLRDTAKILGNLSWAIQAIPFAQGHFRSIQRFYISESQRANMDLSTRAVLDFESRSDLMWWATNVERVNGKGMAVLSPDITIFSDASLSGWGAVMNSVSAKGPWTLEDQGKHINELELLAAFFALKAFTSSSTGISVCLMLDNITAVHYINKSGGSRSERLCRVSTDIVGWCESRGMSIQAIYLPGALNVFADRLSRDAQDSSDWKLCPSVFSALSRRWNLKVDLFASAWNKQLDSFVSWGAQPEALAMDAFSISWKWLRGYAFPPFCLIQRCLAKIMRDQAELTLLTPLWPSQHWFPAVLELACEPAQILPKGNLLVGPLGQPHPLSESLLLVAWRLSGVISKQLAFRTKWSRFSWEERVTPHVLLTNRPGTVGEIGTFDGVRIPCLLI